MPKAKTHNKVNFVLLAIILSTIYFVPPVKVYIYKYATNITVAVFVVSYIFSNYYLSPDLDLKSNACLKRWGPFKIVWRPYSWLFDHRKISHSLLFGTLTRILYLLIAGIFILYILDIVALLKFDWRIILQEKYYFIAIISGLYLPGVFHSITDRIL